METCGSVVYAGLVKKDKVWYDVTRARPAEWADWSNSGDEESYSDCAKLDINTGQYSQGLSSFKLYINSKVRGTLKELFDLRRVH